MQRSLDKRPILYPTIVQCIEQCIDAFGKIPEGRKKTLNELSRFIEAKLKSGEQALLIFICTHNSRRSHIAQLWAQAAAAYYGIDNVIAFSGGTEVTAFNSRAVKTMEEIGFRITRITQGENPFYEVRFSDDFPPIKAFSKKYDDAPNPGSIFAAIMTCSHADQNCPIVNGAEMRFRISFDDPKDYDGTPEEAAKYKERAYQIGREILYSFSQIKTPGIDTPNPMLK